MLLNGVSDEKPQGHIEPHAPAGGRHRRELSKPRV